MAAQLITVRLARGDAQPWGFRLQGGADFGTPLLVQKVNGGSLADQAGLMPGDAVIKINDMDIFPLRHKDAQDLVVRSGNTFVMTVQRGGSTWRPHVTPTGQMPSHQSHLGNNISTVTRTSLAHKQPQPVEHIGCGYNNAARPFNSLNGGDGHVKSIVNKQYNTPVGIYSEEAIAETLSAQAEVLAGGVLGVNFKKNEKEYNPTNSEVLKFLKEEESNPQEPEPYAPANFFWTASHAIGGCKSPGHPRTPTQQTDERVGTPLEQNTLAPTAAHRPSLPQTAPTTEPTNTTSSVPESTPVQTSWKPESSFQQQQRQQEQNQETSHMKTTEGSTTKSGLTQCDNCGMGIVGVFCRIKDKNLHVECFKCATCGTPLKNQGYYNYNNKLYCDIHAKLAAMQNPPPGTDGYIPIPIKPTPKLSASNIANALNAHGYNLQTNGATPHLITGPMPPSGNHDQNVTSSANPLQVSHSRASSSSSTSSGTTGKSSSCLSSLSQQSYTSLDKFSSGHNRQSSFGGGERGGGLGAGGEGEGSVARGVADDGERYRIDGITNDLNGSLNENTSYPKFNNYNRECTLHPQINLSLSIPQPLATTISNKQLELNTTKNPIKFEQNSGLKKSTTMNNNNNNLQNENDMNSNNNGHNYNQFLNKYSNKTSNGDGIDNQRCVSPFPHIPFPPETDDPSYGKISPFPTIPPPINQQMQYVTLQGNVIRSVIPPGKGISVDYKVGSHGGPRPFNQGPMSPQMSGPRSPASYPPVQPQQQQQQQNWAQQPKPVGQSPYATLPRTNASQQGRYTNQVYKQPVHNFNRDTTNSCDSPPLPPPPPPEFLKQIMENPVPKNTINLMNNNNSSLPTKSIEQEPKYIPGQATEMLANSVEKININNKKNFMIEASKVLSNLLEARIANNNNNNYNKNQMFAKANEETMAKPLPNHPLKNIIEICDTETIPCPEEPKPKNEVTLSKTELNTSTKNLTDNNCELKPIETVTFRNKNSNISDKSKRLSTQALDRRSYIEKDFARNGNKIANIPNDQLNAELAKNVSADLSDGKLPVCCQCNTTITKGPFITALGRIWCPEHFMCVNGSCRRPLQDIGFVEEKGDLYCEYCFEKYLAPTCSKCNNKIKGDCLNAIGRHFHPECFICAYCGKLFGNTPFFLEEGEPYCEADWNELFTTKCYACGFPVEAGDRWVEALNHNYHSQCFNCTMCRKNLEGTSFYNKGGRPYCKNHAR